MPVYEYQCKACGAIEDKIVSMDASDAKTFKCACGKRMKKIMSATFITMNRPNLRIATKGHVERKEVKV